MMRRYGLVSSEGRKRTWWIDSDRPYRPGTVLRFVDTEDEWTVTLATSAVSVPPSEDVIKVVV